jgi:lipoprotein-anchoring transpeptidase ErfK/SrfK
MRRRLSAPALGALVLATVLLVLPSTVAGAQTGGSVTLEASAGSVTYGSRVTFTGTVTPVAAGRAVQLLDEAGEALATTSTDATGAFSVAVVLDASSTVRAASGGAESAPVIVEVQAKVSVRLGRVRLFDRAVARGSVAPVPEGTTVHVPLVLAGRVVAGREVAAASGGAFRATFPVRRPGTYRVRAASTPAGLARGSASAGPAATALPSLKIGSHGTFVRLLERRLAALHYRLVGIDGAYDLRTGDAVLAFRKVQGMTRTPTVDAAVWRRLADPRIPKPRATTKAFHIEVDQTRQVLYTVDGGVVTNVIHVSTGANGATLDGSFHVYRKLAGFSPNHLYYPSYFNGLRAIHGWTEVPSYPASHGCVRVPYWNAKWIFGFAMLGTRVLVYH